MNLFKNLFNYRQMIFGLVHRDLRGRYKGSVLGFLWTFINPLLQLGVYTLLFSVIMRSDIEKYYLFLFVALVPWLFFSTCLAGGCGCIAANANLVTKIYFPREVLPISFVSSAFVNMLYSFVVVFAVLILTGFGVNPVALLYLPLIFLVEFVLCLGVTLFFSALTVYVRDLEHILGILSMLMQFLTPVMYSSERVPSDLRPIFNLNPMSPIVECYRSVLYYKAVPHVGILGSAVVFGAVVLILGELIFSRLQKGFAEEL